MSIAKKSVQEGGLNIKTDNKQATILFTKPDGTIDIDKAGKYFSIVNNYISFLYQTMGRTYKTDRKSRKFINGNINTIVVESLMEMYDKWNELGNETPL